MFAGVSVISDLNLASVAEKAVFYLITMPCPAEQQLMNSVYLHSSKGPVVCNCALVCLENSFKAVSKNTFCV